MGGSRVKPRKIKDAQDEKLFGTEKTEKQKKAEIHDPDNEKKAAFAKATLYKCNHCGRKEAEGTLCPPCKIEVSRIVALRTL